MITTRCPRRHSKKSQLGSAVTEYLPIVALIAIAAVRVVWGEYGTTLMGQGSTISTELAGSPTQSGFGDGSSNSPFSGSNGNNSSGNGTNGGASNGSNGASSGSGSAGNSGANGANGSNNSNGNNTSNGGSNNGDAGSGGGVAGTGNGDGSGSEDGGGDEGNGNVVTQEETDESILAQAAQFAGGLATGLRTQFRGLVELVTNPIESAQALFKLAESLVRDPVGTLSTIAEEIGEDIAAVASGDPHEIGRVIGENVSPAALFRIVSKLSDIARATRRLDTGCSSFMEGTLVWTEDGLMPIEQIAVGTEVLARSDASFEDEYQPVKQLFTRQADYYYTLSTGFEEIHVTAEHPFWVQGEGWVNAEHLTAGSAIATANGDILVRTITRNDTPITVYNFEVETDHTYFVSDNGLWVHNSNVVCDLANQDHNRRAGDRLPDGGPGVWVRETIGEREAAYQTRVTDAPAGWAYQVADSAAPSGFTKFDGFDLDRNVLLDAKCWTCWPIDTPFSVNDVVGQAKRQIRAARDLGSGVEWHVPSQATANRIRDAYMTYANQIGNTAQRQQVLNDLNSIRIVITPE